jgi:hypothetical protein
MCADGEKTRSNKRLSHSGSVELASVCFSSLGCLYIFIFIDAQSGSRRRARSFEGLVAPRGPRRGGRGPSRSARQGGSQLLCSLSLSLRSSSTRARANPPDETMPDFVNRKMLMSFCLSYFQHHVRVFRAYMRETVANAHVINAALDNTAHKMNIVIYL